jgi:hypothetical protein
MNRRRFVLLFGSMLLCQKARVARAHDMKLPDGRTFDASKLHVGTLSCCGGEAAPHCQVVPARIAENGAWLDLGEPWGKKYYPFSSFQPPIPEIPNVTVACWNHDAQDEVIMYCKFLEAIGT